jgi:hypothetical protein
MVALSRDEIHDKVIEMIENKPGKSLDVPWDRNFRGPTQKDGVDVSRDIDASIFRSRPESGYRT